MLPFPSTHSLPTTTTSTTSLLDEDDLYDDDLDDEESGPKPKKSKCLWDNDIVETKSTECSMMWYFARPELSTLFVVIKCFTGILIDIQQASCTTLRFTFKVDFNNDELTVISQYCNIDFALARHSLPPREINTTIDVKRTILDVTEKSDEKSPIKVFRVKVQDEHYDKTHLTIKI